MDYLKYFTSYFSSEKTYTTIKEDKVDLKTNKVDFDEFDKKIVNSINKQMMYSKTKVDLKTNKLSENSPLLTSNNNIANNINNNNNNNKNKIKFIRKNSLSD